jgi:hypothetical protein
MKKQNIVLAVVSSLISLGASASAETVFDTDGFERYTEYKSGPISSSHIVSEYVHLLEVYLSPRSAASCSSASVYAIDSGEYISTAYVGFAGGSNGRIINAKAQISEENLLKNKVMEVNCTNEQGGDYNIRVNVPGAPVIEWQASVESTGEFVSPIRGFGYHSAFDFSSNINVNNQSNNSYCQSVQKNNLDIPLFNGQNGKGSFHSDVFVSQNSIDNSESPRPTFHQVIECRNAAGTTKAVKVWDLTNSNGIELIHDEIIIH